MANRITTLFDFEARGLSKIKADIKGTDGLIGKMRVGIKSTIGEFRQSNAAQAAAIGTIAVGAKKAIDAASDLDESINAVQVTFGKAADGVLKLSENSAKSVGLARSDFNSLAVQFSAFAKQIASEDGRQVSDVIDDMTKRVADFASVMNLDANEAAQVFMSTMAGQTEPIRRYGKDVSAAAVEQYALANGLIESKDQLTESIKVQARYGLLMQQTSDTAGDFANTSDSLANSQRIAAAQAKDLAAEMGQTLAPALATVVQGLTEIMDLLDAIGFDELMRGIGDLDKRSLAIGRSIRGFFDEGARANFEYVASVERAEKVAGEFNMRLVDGATSFNEVREAALEHVEAMGENIDAHHAANLIALEWNDTIKKERDELQAAQGGAMNHVAALDASARAVDKARQETDEYRRSLEQIRNKYNEAKAALDRYKNALDTRSSVLRIQEQVDQLGELRAAWETAEAGTQEAETAARNYEQAVISIKQSVIDWANGIKGMPAQVTTNLMLAIDQGRFDYVEQWLGRLGSGVTVPIKPQIVTTSSGTRIYVDEFGNVRNRHTGGRVSPGDVIQPLSGEAFVPDTGGRVMSREDVASTRTTGGVVVHAPITLNVTGEVIDDRTFEKLMTKAGPSAARMISDQLERWYRNGGRAPRSA